MANKLTMNISTIDQTGKKSQKAVTDINPTATNEQLTDFAQALNDLTNNTYVNSTKVQVTDLSDESAKFTRPIVVKFNGDVVEGDELEVPLNETVTFEVYQGEPDGDPVFIDAPAYIELSNCTSDQPTDILNHSYFSMQVDGVQPYKWSGKITELKSDANIGLYILASDTYAEYNHQITLKEAE